MIRDFDERLMALALACRARGLRLGYYVLLRSIHSEMGTLTVGALAARHGVSGEWMSVLLRRMEALGHICRKRGAARGMCVFPRVTPAGVQLLDDLTAEL